MEAPAPGKRIVPRVAWSGRSAAVAPGLLLPVDGDWSVVASGVGRDHHRGVRATGRTGR